MSARETRLTKANKGDTSGNNSDPHSNVAGSDQNNMPSILDIAATLQRIENKVDDTKSTVSTMQSDIKGMKSDITNIKASLESTEKTAAEALFKANNVDTQLKTVNSDIDYLKNELAKSKHENRELKDSLVRIEAHSRRNNLIFKGVPETVSENPFQIVFQILEEKMGFTNAKESIKISRCHRLGPKRPNKNRPLIFKLHYYPDREAIWKSKKKLKHSKIWISEDFPQEIMKKRSLLEAVCQKANSLGKEAFLSVDRMILNGKPHTVDQLKTLAPELHPEEVFTRRSDTHTAFYSRHSPLSNFFPSKFKKDGIMFTSSEQHFQYMKALYCDELDIARQILQTDDPATCKTLGHSMSIPDLQVWQDEARETMYSGCFEKFRQNPKLKDFLMSTRDTVILEASADTFWGIGLRITDENVFKPECWNGSNHLGKILRKIRDTFLST